MDQQHVRLWLQLDPDPAKQLNYLLEQNQRHLEIPPD